MSDDQQRQERDFAWREERVHDDIPSAAQFAEYTDDSKIEWAKDHYQLVEQAHDSHGDWDPPELTDAVGYIEDVQSEEPINVVLARLRVWWAKRIREELERIAIGEGLSAFQLRF